MSIFKGSGKTPEQMQTLLTEAVNAYSSLSTGTMTISIERDGRKVTFNQANKSDLLIYIQELQGGLGITTGRSSPGRFTF